MILARDQLARIALKMAKPRPGEKIPSSPWFDPDLTDCELDNPSVSMREGIVVTVSGKTFS